MSNIIDDNILVSRAKSGNAEALTILLEKYSENIMQKSLTFKNLNGLESDDLYQEGMIGFVAAVYSFDEKKVQIKLGRVLLHRTKEGYSVYLPEFMLEKAFIPRYRIKVSAFLLKRVENARLLVQSDEKNLEVLIQETIDFEL